MTNELAIIDYDSPKMIQTLKATVAKDLNDHEFALFAQHCKGTGLNPFKKEVWAIKAGGRLQVMTGVNGFFAIANRHQLFDGYETGLIDPTGDYKTLAYPKNDFIGAWCKVYRKDRRMPSEAIAMLSEYKKATPIWKDMPRVMIAKCAESVALRKAFPQEMNGLYTEEEMPATFSRGKGEPINITPAEKESEPLQFSNPITRYYRIPYELDEANIAAMAEAGFEQADDELWKIEVPLDEEAVVRMKPFEISKDEYDQAVSEH